MTESLLESAQKLSCEIHLLIDLKNDVLQPDSKIWVSDVKKNWYFPDDLKNHLATEIERQIDLKRNEFKLL